MSLAHRAEAPVLPPVSQLLRDVLHTEVKMDLSLRPWLFAAGGSKGFAAQRVPQKLLLSLRMELG